MLIDSFIILFTADIRYRVKTYIEHGSDLEDALEYALMDTEDGLGCEEMNELYHVTNREELKSVLREKLLEPERHLEPMATWYRMN